MAYLKYKELTQYFNFHKELEIDTLPKYVTDYLYPKEEIWNAFATKRDKGIFTESRIILFDQKGLLGKSKEITTVPYFSISTASIKFGIDSVDMFMYLDSGYPFRLRFVRLTPESKSKLRILFSNITEKISKMKK